MNAKLKLLKEKANKLPITPGVYIMKNKHGDIIYIGKAKVLKNRVTQYFGSNTNHNEKVRKMVSNVDEFDYILCDSEFEAFLLENSLIKQHQPKYNILLKDDKGYHYIKITNEKWRRIFWTMQKNNDGAKYIGPYNSSYIVKNTVDEVQKVFKLPTCNRSFDKKSKPCLNFHIGICSAPCSGKIRFGEYNAVINSAVDFIKKGGYSSSDIRAIEKEMLRAAESLDFEKAAHLRDRIKALKGINEKQKVIAQTYKEQDVFASVVAGGTVCVQLLKFRNGNISDQNSYIIESEENKSEFYGEFLPRYYSNTDDIPPRIVLDSETEYSHLIEEWLTEITKRNIHINVPKMGDQKKLIDMCLNNAADMLSKHINAGSRETGALNELSSLLGLKSVPRIIESYDISNISGSENVASMVVHKDGKPYRNFYRKFKIKSFAGQDDFRSMAEVLDRRFNEYEKGEDAAFKELPDLILLDGGRGQISAVLPVLEKHGINVPMFGMVKDNKHRTKAIATADGEIALKPTRTAFTLVTKIQDETHRVAISYHKQRRSKSMVESELLKIPGVGEKRMKALMVKFKSLKAIKTADKQQLCSVPGITADVADNILNFFSE